MPRTTVTIPRDLVPLAEGASYGRVCKATVRNWIASGLITGYRRGPKLLFVSLGEIDAMTRATVPAAAAR